MTEQAKKVCSLLIQKGIRQKMVAEMATVKPSCVSSVINGREEATK